MDDKSFLLANPFLFILHYFDDIVPELKDFHVEVINVAATKHRGLILIPAAHGKSTLISTLIPIWEVCCNPNVRVVVIAKNDQEAKNIMRAIQAELLGNEKLVNDFGPFYDEGKAWSLNRIEVAKRTITHKSGTIAVFGAGSRGALGYRADVVIADDIVHDKNSNTPLNRSNLRQWFNQGPETMNEDLEDRLIVVGTIFDVKDLYSELASIINPETGEPVYYVYRKDAIVDEDTKETLWPERWPWERLMAQKAAMGSIDFNKRYRNIAVNKEGMLFREEYIKGGMIGNVNYPGCLDDGYCVGDFDPGWKIVQGFDPAVGVSRQAKFCAHVTLAEGSCPAHKRCFFVVDIEHGQWPLPDQARLIISKFEKYKPLEARIETNAYQGGLKQVVDEILDESGKAYTINQHQTGKNKLDSEIGIEAMSPWFENGKVHIPWGNPESIRKMTPFVDELVMYPALTTDIIMAFWFAWLAAQERQSTLESYNYLDGKKGSLYRLGRGRTIQNPYYATQ
jgi:hypothetical protein